MKRLRKALSALPALGPWKAARRGRPILGRVRRAIVRLSLQELRAGRKRVPAPRIPARAPGRRSPS